MRSCRSGARKKERYARARRLAADARHLDTVIAHGDHRPLAPIYVKSLAIGEGTPDAIQLSSEFDDEPAAANDSN